MDTNDKTPMENIESPQDFSGSNGSVPAEQLEGVRVKSSLWSLIITFGLFVFVLIAGGIYWLLH
ncbi:hypothetical protein [Mucilaginibacter galii]